MLRCRLKCAYGWLLYGFTLPPLLPQLSESLLNFSLLLSGIFALSSAVAVIARVYRWPDAQSDAYISQKELQMGLLLHCFSLIESSFIIMPI